MDYIKEIERDLKNLEATKKSLEILPLTIKNNKAKVYIIKKALDNMTEKERKVLQLICIEDKKPWELEEEFGMTERSIYVLKNATLKKFARIVYGIELWERDDKK